MPTRTPEDGADGQLTDERLLYLRQLLSLLQRDDEAGSDGERIILDVDLDGQRYLLVAMPQHDPRMASLSPREIEIARLVSMGHPNKVIAAVLEISSWTVCTHMRRMFVKLSVNSRAAMVAKLAETNQGFGRASVLHGGKLPARAEKALVGAESFAGLGDDGETFAEAGLPLTRPNIDARRSGLSVRPDIVGLERPLLSERAIASRRVTFAR
jgi:DNA-binding CsgD family transcriptional regulator